MALGVRGSNPLWVFVNLTGQLFDDTYYMYVLENTIPYIPVVVYHDPDLNVPWTSPIQCLGNGIFPIDIFYLDNQVYRLEFRQNNGVNPPSQSDALIYEVNNYVPASGGVNPIDMVTFASSNQMTNPQFALFNLQSPVTISATDPPDIDIAPGWVLSLAGTGTVTITQVALNNSNTNPSNAPYALRLTLNGWTTDSVVLRQRFEQNGMLWANKIVSSALTAQLQGAPQDIMATLVDSNASVLATVLPLTPISEGWNEFTGYGSLTATTNPDLPPAAYIDYKLALPSNIDIYLTSFQLLVQDLPIQPSFTQDSINRQIDYTYNTAYPIVPIGSTIDFAGFKVPTHYYLCDGTAYSRVSDYLLFTALTTSETVTLTSTMNTFIVVSSADYAIGMAIEGNGIPSSTIISNISGTTITISNAATISGASTILFFAWGNGDGSTTFNVPDQRGYVTAGANGNLFAGVSNGVGLQGGSSTHTQTIAEMPSHNHPPLSPATNFVSSDAVTGFSSGTGGLISVATTGNRGGGNPFTIVQPTNLMKRCIRFE